MSEVTEMYELAKREWAMAAPYLLTLLAVMALDVLMGLTIAVKTRKLSSSASWAGISKKMGVLIVIALAGVLDPMIPVPLALIVCTGYIVPESLSIIENACKLGVTRNATLMKYLDKLNKEVEGETEENEE